MWQITNLFCVVNIDNRILHKMLESYCLAFQIWCFFPTTTYLYPHWSFYFMLCYQFSCRVFWLWARDGFVNSREVNCFSSYRTVKEDPVLHIRLTFQDTKQTHDCRKCYIIQNANIVDQPWNWKLQNKKNTLKILK